MAPDTIETLRFSPLGSDTIWPLTSGTEELAKTIFETTSCHCCVTGIDDTRVFGMVGCTGTEVIAGWEVMFVTNRLET